MRRAAVCLAASLVSFTAAATELEDGTFLFDADSPLPADILTLVECGPEDSPFATRKPFPGGFLFAIQCPGNNENFMETLIFSQSEDGTDARLLRFHGPDDIRDDFADVVSNVRTYADKNEIGEIFVDREVDERADPNVCRTEGRWRLEGAPLEPKLVFWRETSDCDGKADWKIIVGSDPEN